MAIKPLSIRQLPDWTPTGDSYIEIQAPSDSTTGKIKLADICSITSDVNSVNGKTWTVVLDKTDIWLDNVDNTSDTDKPVSTAIQTALDSKVDTVAGKWLSTNDYTDADETKLDTIETGAEVNTLNSIVAWENVSIDSTDPLNPVISSDWWGDVESVNGQTGVVVLDKTDIWLENVDNTSDVNKPVSTATQTALDDKVDKEVWKWLSTNDYTDSEKTKLAGIEELATANSTDATLLDRANHTWTQTASTISDFDTEVSNNTSVVANTAKISFDSVSSTRLANTSWTNTGDNAVNTLYSWLEASKEDTITYPTESPETKYYRWDKTFHEIIIWSGGFSGNAYLSNTASTDIGGYTQIGYDLDVNETEKTITVSSAGTTIDNYLSEAEVWVTTIPAGTWRAAFYGKINSDVWDTRWVFTIFKRSSAGVETDLFSITSEEMSWDEFQRVIVESSQNSFTVLTTDRLWVRTSATATSGIDKTITYIVWDGRGAYFNTPLPIKHEQLRDKNSEDAYQHITNTQKTVLENTSWTNSWDNAVNSLYSWLEASKQDKLVSWTNIKTINSTSVLWSGNIEITGGVEWPTSSTDWAIALFDWTDGDTIKDSAKTIVTTLGADDTTVPTSKAVSDAIWSSGGWDMLKTVYDPNTVEWDAFDYDNMSNKPIINIDSPNLDTLLTPWLYRITGTPTSSDSEWAGIVNQFCITLKWLYTITDDLFWGAWAYIAIITFNWAVFIRWYYSTASSRDVVNNNSALVLDWEWNYIISNDYTLKLEWTGNWNTQLATANTSATNYVATLPAKTGTIAMTDDIFSGSYNDLTEKPTIPDLTAIWVTMLPTTDDDYNIWSSSKRFQDIWIADNVYTDNIKWVDDADTYIARPDNNTMVHYTGGSERLLINSQWISATGNISVTWTVDWRDVATDWNKLDLLWLDNNTRASSTSLTPANWLNVQEDVTALAAALTINAPTGTPVNWSKLIIRILDNWTARALTWNAIYRAIWVTLPTTTTVSKTVYVWCIYNSGSSKRDVVAVSQEA